MADEGVVAEEAAAAVPAQVAEPAEDGATGEPVNSPLEQQQTDAADQPTTAANEPPLEHANEGAGHDEHHAVDGAEHPTAQPPQPTDIPLAISHAQPTTTPASPPTPSTTPSTGARVRGAEVFIGGLPRHLADDDLRTEFEEFGEVVSCKIMRNPLGESKGFAFLRFTTREAAQRATSRHETELQGRKIGVTISSEHDTLFLGNLRKEWTQHDIEKLARESFDKVDTVELATLPPGEQARNPRFHNRGFAFIRFHDHAAAVRAQKMAQNPTFKLGGVWRPVVDWAESQRSTDEHEMAKVKAIYVGNVPNDVDDEQLRIVFSRFGEVEKATVVKKQLAPIGFVHFTERQHALDAIDAYHGKEVDFGDGIKAILQVSLARPAEQTKKRLRAEQQAAGGRPHLGAPSPYGAPGPGSYGAPPGPYDGPPGPYGGPPPPGPFGDSTYGGPPPAKRPQFAMNDNTPYERAMFALSPSCVRRLQDILDSGLATRSDIDLRAVESLQNLPEAAVLAVFDQFQLSDFSGVRNKTAYFVGCINRVRKDYYASPAKYQMPSETSMGPPPSASYGYRQQMNPPYQAPPPSNVYQPFSGVGGYSPPPLPQQQPIQHQANIPPLPSYSQQPPSFSQQPASYSQPSSNYYSQQQPSQNSYIQSYQQQQQPATYSQPSPYQSYAQNTQGPAMNYAPPLQQAATGYSAHMAQQPQQQPPAPLPASNPYSMYSAPLPASQPLQPPQPQGQPPLPPPAGYPGSQPGAALGNYVYNPQTGAYAHAYNPNPPLASEPQPGVYYAERADF
eukprot:jgi/Chlat1/8286/Chrsp78S07709